MSTDVIINTDYPGVEYVGTESGEIYYEDREIAGTFYRTQNAQYSKKSLQWSLYNSALPAYAIAQRPDGSTRFYAVAAGSGSFTSWAGNGQDRVFNVKDFGAKGDGTTDDTAAINDAVAAAVNAGGGVVYYPASTYAVSTITGVTGAESTSVFHVGAGRDCTTIKGLYTTTKPVLQLVSQGGVSGMTVSGNGNVVSCLGVGNTEINSASLSAAFSPPAIGSSGSFTVGTFTVGSITSFATGQNVVVGGPIVTTLTANFSPPAQGSSGTFSVASAMNFAIGQTVVIGVTVQGVSTAYLGTITGVSGTNITATTQIQGSSWLSGAQVLIQGVASTLTAAFAPPALNSSGTLTVASAGNFAVGQTIAVGVASASVQPYSGTITGISGTSVTVTTTSPGNQSTWPIGTQVQVQIFAAYLGSVTSVNTMTNTVTATTLVQGSQSTWATGSFVQSGNFVDFAFVSDVRCTDIGSQSGVANWLLVSAVFPEPWGVEGTNYLIRTLWLNRISLDGPSSTYQDAMGIGYVDKCFATDIAMRNLARSPNFYFINELTINGCFVSGGSSTTIACLVVDNAVQHAVINGLIVDGTNKYWPLFQARDCTVSNSTFLTPYVNVGSSGVNLSTVGMRFVGCLMTCELVYLGINVINWLEIVGCRIAPTTSVLFCILNDQSSAIVANISIRSCILDTSNVTYSVIGVSYPEPAMTNCQILNNVILGPHTILPSASLGNLTVGTGNVICGNVTTNTAPTFVGVSPSTTLPTSPNGTGYDCTLYIYKGSVTQVKIGATIVFASDGTHAALQYGSFRVPAGQAFTVSGTGTFALVPDSIS